MSAARRTGPPCPLDKVALDAAAAALRARGYAVVADLLPLPLLQALAADCDARQAAGHLRRAGTGRGEGHRLEQTRRGDSIEWLEGDPTDTPAARCLAELERLRVTLDRELLLGLHQIDAHYAHYPPGAGYTRHRDRFRDDDARVLSLVIYLNADWQADDGGALRLHLPQGALDVPPRLGTSVLFLSAEIEHEVLPARRARRSIAGWFRRRDDVAMRR